MERAYSACFSLVAFPSQHNCFCALLCPSCRSSELVMRPPAESPPISTNCVPPPGLAGVVLKASDVRQNMSQERNAIPGLSDFNSSLRKAARMARGTPARRDYGRQCKPRRRDGVRASAGLRAPCCPRSAPRQAPAFRFGTAARCLIRRQSGRRMRGRCASSRISPAGRRFRECQSLRQLSNPSEASQ